MRLFRITQQLERKAAFDGVGFAMLSLGVGSLQLMLDRGQLKD